MEEKKNVKWNLKEFTLFLLIHASYADLEFTDDEKEAIVGQMRTEATKAGCPPTRESIWQYFINKCANNLHIVLAMSPVGETLRTRCRNFPGLVNNCSIDWFMPWPVQALTAVASVFLGNEDVSIIIR